METLVLRYTLFPDQAGQPDGRIELAPELQGNGGRPQPLPLVPAVADSRAVRQESKLLLDALDAARGGIDDQGDCARVNLDDLAQHADALAGLLLPQAVADVLRRPTLSHVEFVCDPLLNGVPFEACRLDAEYLGFRFATSRWLRSPARAAPPRVPPEARSRGRQSALSGSAEHEVQRRLTSAATSFEPAAPYRAFCLVDPGGDLPGLVIEEFDVFTTDWAQPGLSRQIEFHPWLGRGLDHSEFQDRLRSSDVLTLVCHHTPEGGFDLAGGGASPFGAEDLERAFGPPHRRPRLLFTVCCTSGLTDGWEHEWPRTARLHGMVDAALRVGIPLFVGTWLKVPAVASARLVPCFFRALTEGYTVAEALRRARVSLRREARDASDGASAVGLGFTLYGDGRSSLFCAGKHRVEGSEALLCEAPSADGWCGRTVCPEDPGFGARRCVEHHRPPARCSAGHAVAAAAELIGCKVKGCPNTVCPDCAGVGLGLCWRHCCHEGHEILAGVMKVCPDPRRRHPDEKRSLCPNEGPAYVRGLCRECYEVIQQ